MEEDFVRASMYDKMINWESRLAREIPVISQYFANLDDNPVILDVACSSGRHSFALNKEGFETVGVDISNSFITLAQQLQSELDQTEAEKAQFSEIDASDPALVKAFQGRYFDGAILLGNAIANMGDFASGKQLLKNIFILLRPGGRFFVQTVNKPDKPWYNPLRQKDGVIIQRIMVPEPVVDQDSKHNVVLHVNQIDPENLQYVEQKSDNLFFMYRLDEFRSLVEGIGFEVEAVQSGYEGNTVEDIDGETLIWKLSKPEITMTAWGKELFQQYCGMNEEQVKNHILKYWQGLMLENWYHCIRGYRFLHPRIVSNPQYSVFLEFAKERPSGAYLDLACFIGTDLRRLWIDGVRNLYGIDRSAYFIKMGGKIFRDEEKLHELADNDNSTTGEVENAEIEFLVGDITADDFLVVNDNSEVLGDFARFYQFFTGIHSGSLLHLLEEEEIMLTLRRVYQMLKPGGVFFGRTVGSSTPGHHMSGLRFLHSTDSLRSAFNNVGFSEVDVSVIPTGGPVGESSTGTTLQLSFYVKK